jgi:hypothetical protein
MYVLHSECIFRVSGLTQSEDDGSGLAAGGGYVLLPAAKMLFSRELPTRIR